MNRHLEMSGQVVDVPVDDLLAFAVAVESFAKSTARSACIEKPPGGNGCFPMNYCCYFQFFSIFKINAYAPSEGTVFMALRKVPPKTAAIFTISGVGIRIFCIFSIFCNPMKNNLLPSGLLSLRELVDGTI